MVQLLTLRVGDCWLLLTALPSHDECPTIKVGRQGQIKHILLWKQSSLNQKTNFRTVLMSFCFLFRFVPFFSKKNMGSAVSGGSVVCSGQSLVTPLHDLNNLFFKSVAFSFTDIQYLCQQRATGRLCNFIAAQVPRKEQLRYSKRKVANNEPKANISNSAGICNLTGKWFTDEWPLQIQKPFFSGF